MSLIFVASSKTLDMNFKEIDKNIKLLMDKIYD